MTLKLIPESVVHGKRLGRHVRHDPRSVTFGVAPMPRSAMRSVMWPGSNAEALNQADLGACTGFATAQCLNCDPWGRGLTNADARKIYSLATTKDPFEGQWPPTDTGSSGLAAMQAARELGYIASWQAAFSLDDVLAALQTRPGILGIAWFAGCDAPDSEGRIAPTGGVRGGHEILIAGCDLEAGDVWLRNSWGDWGVERFGQSGYFRLSFLEFHALLVLQGDAYFPGAP